MAEHTMNPPTGAPPETVLAPEPSDAIRALGMAIAVGDVDARHVAVSRAVAQWPTFLDAWAALSEVGRDPIESYAAARVGYHRGLDKLRQGGWKGSGYVRWSYEENRGFLRCLAHLATHAGTIGEADEVARIGGFLKQLDPSWPPATLDR